MKFEVFVKHQSAFISSSWSMRNYGKYFEKKNNLSFLLLTGKISSPLEN
jgi:hypothetical protein